MNSWVFKITILFISLGLCNWSHANPDLSKSELPAVEQKPIPLNDHMPLPPHKNAGEELTERGKNVRGVYVPYTRVSSWKPAKLVRWAHRINANAVIIDVKDDRGRVTFSRDLPYAQGIPHGEIRNMENIVQTLKESNIYVIARLVCFKDNLLVRAKPETAMRDRRTGKIWKDRSNLGWADPHSQMARDHIVSVAKAAEEIGFDEIQLDYIRFPVEPEARYVTFPNREQRIERYNVIARMLSEVDAAISIPLSIDVFGLTAYNSGDRDGLGQSLEHLAPYVDAISPMVYLANWPRRYWENPKPRKTHDLVHGAVRRIRERVGEGVAVRPLLQAFKWRADNWGYGFILNQIDAAVSGGSMGYLFWNQGGNYRIVGAVWRNLKEAESQSPVVSSR